MTTYKIPQTLPAALLQQNEVFLIASGDLRLSANQTCWPAQAEMERLSSAAFAAEGITVRRAHPYDETWIYLEPAHGHGCSMAGH